MNLSEQIAWEQELVERGAQTYWANQDRLRNNSEADKGDAVSFLLRQRMQETAERLEANMHTGRGKGAKYNQLVRSVARGDYLKLAFIALQVIFQKTAIKNHNTLLKICLGIGTRIEADLKCQMFEAEHPAYYNKVMESFKEQKVTDYTHKHKVMMTKFRDFDNLVWKDFEPEALVHIGLRIVDTILEVFDDVFFVTKKRDGIKTTSVVETTVQFDEWMGEFEKARGLLSPARLPLKIPPRDWDENYDGGYYTPSLVQTTPFIKTKSKEHKKFVDSHDPVMHRMAVNKMQRTGWAINRKVLDVQRTIYQRGLGVGIPSNKKVKIPDFPEHLKHIPKERLNGRQKEEVTAWKVLAKAAYGREQKRKSDVIAFMQAFKLAEELKDWGQFYYVFTCDFRGRIYCATSGLSPQGADTAKGLLYFASGETLGNDGIRWLAIQGANTFGKDKLSYDERVKFIRDSEPYIRRVVEDPINTREYWGNADKPYQFLAFCFEWAECDFGRNPKATSRIPVGLDGSCNGLQHYSALLRDKIGGHATNITRTGTPNDIYQDVADRCYQAVRDVDDPRARVWTRVGITRKTAKRPVMTLPYGAKQKSARAAIFEWATENWDKFNADPKFCWELSKWLTPYLWNAIGQTVIAARQGMDWIQKNVPKDDYCKWLTPIGFPVYQYYKETEITIVQTKLCGVCWVKLADLDRYGEPKMSQQRSGIAPNFVHSLDSTHLVMTVGMTNFNSYAMIHDDFGTHAGRTEELFRAIRTAFHKLYSSHDPLLEWAEQVGADTSTLPTKGDYDIDEIIEADYFFG